MDELTAGFLRRQFRLKGRLYAAMAAGGLALGLLTPSDRLAHVAGLLFLLAAWTALGWAAADRTEGPMAAVLAAPHARRPWLVAFLTATALAAGSVGFAALAPHGLRPALVAGLLALAYGWMVAALGLSVLLRVNAPRELHWTCGVLLAVLAAVPPPASAAMKGTAWVWHPLSLFNFSLSQSLLLSGGIPNPSAGVRTVWDLPLHGVIPLLILSLFAWRWTLRALDRLEMINT